MKAIDTCVGIRTTGTEAYLRKGTMDYRREIDGLRALAVLPVILFHAGFQTFSGGFVGVDVFFVISGHLITTIILSDLEQGTFSIVAFYERRARRIMPALFLVMIACIPFAWLSLLPSDMELFAKSVVSVSLFSSNILFWRESGYFDTAAELKPLLHTWSLAVEEQYYVLFPVFLIVTWRFGKRWVLRRLAVIAVASFAAAQWGSTADPAATFFLLTTRGWELLIGAFVAFYLHGTSTWQPSRALREVCGVVGLAMLLYAVFGFSTQTPFPSLYGLVPTVGTALIILFATQQTTVGKFIGNKLFVGVGLISYSAYLWHQPIFAFARHRSLEEPSKLLLSVLAISSLVLAYFSWKYVETPFRCTRSFSRKKVFSFAIAISVAFLSFGLVGYVTKGYESRLPAEQREANVFGNDDVFHGSRGSDGSCRTFLGLRDLSEEVCLANSKEPKLLFVGDSHAMALHSSIFGKQSNFDSLLISAHSCPIYPNLTYTPSYKRRWDNNCTEISEKVLWIAKKISSIDTVVLSNNYAKADDNSSRYFYRDVNLSNKEAFISGYDYLLKELFALGKRVVFVIDVPHLKHENKKCFQTLSRLESYDCRTSTAEYHEMRKSYLAEVAALNERFPELLIYNTAALLCGSEFCEIKLNNKSLYNDKQHISAYASQLFLRDMKEKGFLH